MQLIIMEHNLVKYYSKLLDRCVLINHTIISLLFSFYNLVKSAVINLAHMTTAIIQLDTYKVHKT